MLVIHGLGPSYVYTYISQYILTCPLHFSDSLLLVVPSFRVIHMATDISQFFSGVGPVLQKDLPEQVRHLHGLHLGRTLRQFYFRWHLAGHKLFRHIWL